MDVSLRQVSETLGRLRAYAHAWHLVTTGRNRHHHCEPAVCPPQLDAVL